MKRTLCPNRIIFVGDKHGNAGLHPDIAFVGSKSYNKIVQWIADLDIYVDDVILINKHQIFDTRLNWPDALFIACGNIASEALNDEGIKHFKLPHPSGRNRKLNDKKYEKNLLKECYKWIRE